MNYYELERLIEETIEKRLLCRAELADESLCYFIPRKKCGDLLLATIDSDFRPDGWTIRSIRKLVDFDIARPFHQLLVRKFDEALEEPDIDISDWETVFGDIKSKGIHVSVEGHIDGENDRYVLGIVGEVRKHSVFIWQYDADGVWEPQPLKINYADITNISFGCRYNEAYASVIRVPDFSGFEYEKEPAEGERDARILEFRRK